MRSLGLAVLIGWGTLAIYYSNLPWPAARMALAAAFAVFSIWAAWLSRRRAALVAFAVLWLGVRDTTAGFVCYKRHVLEALPLDEIKFVGYAFQIEMRYRVHLRKYRIAEVPITFVDRLKGKSKMNSSIFKEAILGVINMRLRIPRS